MGYPEEGHPLHSQGFSPRQERGLQDYAAEIIRGDGGSQDGLRILPEQVLQQQ